jgi:hypothetical protein
MYIYVYNSLYTEVLYYYRTSCLRKSRAEENRRFGGKSEAHYILRTPMTSKRCTGVLDYVQGGPARESPAFDNRRNRRRSISFPSCCSSSCCSNTEIRSILARARKAYISTLPSGPGQPSDGLRIAIARLPGYSQTNLTHSRRAIISNDH